MATMRSIEIDIEVHKVIEAERLSFDEAPNDVIRRLLGFGSLPPAPRTTGKAWSGYGVVLPHGTALRMAYNGQTHLGEIRDGCWLVEGDRYTSPSGAASGVAKTKKGGRANLDGWKYWNAKLPGHEDWVSMWALYEKSH